MKMEWFKMQTCWSKAIDILTDEELGRALRNIYAYVLRKEERPGTGREEVFTAMALEMLKRDIEKYEAAVAEEERKKANRRDHAQRAAQARWKHLEEETCPEKNGQIRACSKDDGHEQTFSEQNGHLRACTEHTDIYKDIDTEKEKDTEAEKEEKRSTGSEPFAEASELPVAEIPLNNGTQYPIYRKDVEEYTALYPGVDIEQELRKMRGWCLANPSRRKTKRGVRAFIHTWMCKEQDRAKGSQGCTPENPFLAYALGEKEIGGSLL